MRLNFSRQTKLFLLSTLLYGFAFSVWELFFNLYILTLGFNSDMLGLIRSATPLAGLLPAASTSALPPTPLPAHAAPWEPPPAR